MIPLSDRQDTAGPMTRTVRDTAHVLSIISGESNYDDATSSIPFKHVPDYLELCHGNDLGGIRLGVPRSSILDGEPSALESFERALDRLTSAGATIVDNVKFRSEAEWDLWPKSERKRPLEAEFKASIKRWCKDLTKNPHQIQSVDDLIHFIELKPRELYPEHDIDRLISSRDSPDLDSNEIQDALKKMLRCSAEDGILGALHDYSQYALVLPNDYYRPSDYTARAGMPLIALPLGFYPQGTQTKHTNVGNQVDIAPNIP